MILDRAERKLATWKCYRKGHHYTFDELQEGSQKIWNDEDGFVKCKRCGHKEDIEDCSEPVLVTTRINKLLLKP